MNIGIDTSNSMLQNLSANSRLNQISLAKSDISALQVNNDKEASTALGTSDAKSLAKIKEMVKDYDFTSITQKELAVLSLELYENELIDLQTASHLSLGDANFNADGTGQCYTLMMKIAVAFSVCFHMSQPTASSLTNHHRQSSPAFLVSV